MSFQLRTVGNENLQVTDSFHESFEGTKDNRIFCH